MRTNEPIHPTTGEPTNEARAARVEAAMRNYTKAHYGRYEDDATIVQDFITDLLHWLAQQETTSFPPRKFAERAIEMFEEETAQE